MKWKKIEHMCVYVCFHKYTDLTAWLMGWVFKLLVESVWHGPISTQHGVSESHWPSCVPNLCHFVFHSQPFSDTNWSQKFLQKVNKSKPSALLSDSKSQHRTLWERTAVGGGEAYFFTSTKKWNFIIVFYKYFLLWLVTWLPACCWGLAR